MRTEKGHLLLTSGLFPDPINPAKPFSWATARGLLCVTILPHMGSGVNKSGMDGEIMIDQILNFYSDGKLSDGAAMAGIIISRFGPMNDQQLAKRMSKSVRQIKRYICELSNLSPVSKLDFNNSKELTNQQEQNTVCEVLSKYGKLPLLSKVNTIFVKHQIEPNAAALDYIVQYVLKGVKCGRVHNFSQYLQYMIPIMWGEALVETAPEEDSPTTIPDLPKHEVVDENPNRPEANQEANQEWQKVFNNISTQVSSASLEAYIKRMIPVHKKDSTLYLAVENSFAKEWILHRFGNLFNAAFSNICMNYEIILDEVILSKIA